MTEQKYNGWTNYETWLVALWLDNEQETQWQCNNLAKMARRREEDLASAIQLLAEWLKDEFGLPMPELEGMWADLLNAAWSRVDWYEIADHYMDAVEEHNAAS